MQEVAVHEVLGRTLQIVGHEISAKKLTVSTHLHAPIDHIIGDPARYTLFLRLASARHLMDGVY